MHPVPIALPRDGQQWCRGVECGHRRAAQTGQQDEKTRTAADIEELCAGNDLGGVEHRA